MPKLPNTRQSLDAIVAMPDGRSLGEAELVAVSDLTDSTAIDPKGLPWKAHVMKDYRVQQAAVAAGVIKKESALPPHFALDILRSSDHEDDDYTVMALIVPSKGHKFGFKAIGIVRPDIVVAQGVPEAYASGSMYIKLWFPPLIDPAYEGAKLTIPGNPTLANFLFSAGVQRVVRPIAEYRDEKDIMVVCDNQCNPSTLESLIKQHGFKILVKGVPVSSLPEKKKSGLDKKAGSVSLLVRPTKQYENNIPWPLAEAIVKEYLVSGYDAPPNGKLVEEALFELDFMNVGGKVLYRPA